MPLTHLTLPQYDKLYNIGTFARYLLINIDTNINNSKQYKCEKNLCTDVNGDISKILGSIYNYEFNGFSRQLVYVAYIKFNDTILHIIQAVVFSGSWDPISYEYISKIKNWKDFLPQIEECQKNYPKINAELIVDYVILEKDDKINIALLEKRKYKEFLASLRYTTSMVYRLNQYEIYDNPAEILTQWLKEWDIEPGGLAAQKAKEEFESLSQPDKK